MARRKLPKIKLPKISKRQWVKFAKGLDKGANVVGNILQKVGKIGATVAPFAGPAAPYIEAGSQGAMAVGTAAKTGSVVGHQIADML
jgi:hypothetical protein